MTADPAAPDQLGASPADAILSWMQSRTVTQGWDVICAIAIDKINEWFLQQYVDRLSGGEDAVINGTVPLTGDESIQAVNLTLGPPLISFSPTSSADSVELTINFLSGQVNHTKNVAGSSVITSVQTVTPGDKYQLHGDVPLASVQGEVENSHDVVIDIRNSASFAAHLGMAEGAETPVGTFMRDWLVNHMDGYKYKLGTLDYKDNGTNLKPTCARCPATLVITSYPAARPAPATISPVSCTRTGATGWVATTWTRWRSRTTLPGRSGIWAATSKPAT